MQEERMAILKMIDEGKISVDEAAKLFAALGAKPCDPQPSFEEKWAKFQEDAKEFFKEMGQKFGQACEKARPKLESATKTVVAKTASIADNISQSLNQRVAKMESSENQGRRCCNSPNCCGNQQCTIHKCERSA